MDLMIEKAQPDDLREKPDENNLGFGRYFTDHMFTMQYQEGQGWHEPVISRYHPFTVDPAAMVLHYGQAIFEGLKAYRGKDYATNVLSFVYESEPRVVGDLVVCLPVVLREAAAQGKSAEAHFAHLIVHGMLHLQGYDHIDPAEAEIMESREVAILKQFRIPNPYSS